MKRFILIASLLAVFAAVLLFQAAPARNFLGSTPAREFPAGLDWINTDEPLTLEALKGKIVLLDFWTYGCINCIHVIPELQELERKYADELVVIGVHSAKFTNEAETANIRLIAERYERTHPIVNDRDFAIWRSYGIAAWPSFILIDPEGRVLGRHSGEGILDLFDGLISGMISTFEERGTLDRSPLDFNTRGVVIPRAALRFPAQVLADGAGQRLFIADSGNHRIVVTDFSGEVLEVIGSGNAELRDGSFTAAGFRRPHGMTLADPASLYVADTGNHSIRLVDLERRTVTTVAGTGEQEYLFGRDRVTAASSGLNSPWDVLWLDGQLFIAMAGQHQLWRYDPAAGSVWLHAGSGREELRDGALLEAGLNQPSGLASDGEVLFVADSEASAVRRADLAPDGQLDTIVGIGLFDFGDVDGVGEQVRLQHPKALAYADGLIYLADTYNNRIKRLDPASRESVTLLGTGEAGWRDGSAAQFHEPGGLSVLNGQLFIADTNNHAVRVADLETLEVTTLRLSDPRGLLQARAADPLQFDEILDLPVARLGAGEGSIRLELGLPAGYTANHLAPLQVSWSSADETVAAAGPAVSVAAPRYPLTLEFPLLLQEGSTLLSGDAVIYYCRELSNAVCLIRQVRFQLPLEVSGAAANSVVPVAWQPPALPAGY